ncbi:carboxymuconolactone decarboxylase family protein [Corynebacterium aquatimens]|uniref:carboxymuconolactone decarboxylase family protein n=1 Tax=Corynebacterium TaxID=1716 RepID=UPI001F2A90D6|nr:MULTISPECIES: carboxymuconolactone decarboxylase family protein [Corynebacterium]QYH20252.1 carboxymuconolactone decarboxylase family protein [Corynebacterium aquatimens]UIZ92481.1 carboxymuconolactone decarboxylase family protein [Corynebacterium sp. CNCTC7651]
MTTRELNNDFQAPFFPAVKYLSQNVDPETSELVCLRASALNGCKICTATHRRNSRQIGFSEEKILAVESWPEHKDQFTDKELAVLELTDAVTKLPERENSVSDELWNRVVEHYGEDGTRNILVGINTINVFNRFGIAAQLDPTTVEGATDFDLGRA